jgi:hypothetical protein
MRLTAQTSFRVTGRAAFPGRRLRRLATDSACHTAAVAIETPSNKSSRIGLLTWSVDGVPSTESWWEGRHCRALAWGPTGSQLSAAAGDELMIGRARPEKVTHVGPDVNALGWIGHDHIVAAAAIRWPPLIVFDNTGSVVAELEPDLPSANTLNPALHVATSAAAIAFCYEWRNVVVMAGADAGWPQHVVSTPAGESAHALAIWIDAAAERVLVAPWPRVKDGTPLQLWRGYVAEGTLNPWLLLPSTAVVEALPSLDQVLVAPVEDVGAIHLCDEQGTGIVARVPGRLWGIRLAASFDSMIAWTEDTVFRLERNRG